MTAPAPTRRKIVRVKIICASCGRRATVSASERSKARKTCSEPCRRALWRARQGHGTAKRGRAGDGRLTARRIAEIRSRVDAAAPSDVTDLLTYVATLERDVIRWRERAS